MYVRRTVAVGVTRGRCKTNQALMLWGTDGEQHGVTHGLVKRWVRPFLVDVWQVTIRHVVLNVTHLMMGCSEVT